MRHLLLLLIALIWAPLPILAHVGSPNIFYEGDAGTYHLRVTIRPPGVLPGAAQVDIRTRDSGVTARVQPLLWETDARNGIEPVSAVPVSGETNLL
ncbi:MAG TPA: hypothetical protein VGE41_01330, partial [Verrucomicrobiae bacterium]